MVSGVFVDSGDSMSRMRFSERVIVSQISKDGSLALQLKSGQRLSIKASPDAEILDFDKVEEIENSDEVIDNMRERKAKNMEIFNMTCPVNKEWIIGITMNIKEVDV